MCQQSISIIDILKLKKKAELLERNFLQDGGSVADAISRRKYFALKGISSS